MTNKNITNVSRPLVWLQMVEEDAVLEQVDRSCYGGETKLRKYCISERRIASAASLGLLRLGPVSLTQFF